MNIDIVMWSMGKKGLLTSVFMGIEAALASVIHDRIFVVNSGDDEGIPIAEEWGWKIYVSGRGGIQVSANEALRHVTTEYFISVENDVILDKDWLAKILPLMADPKVAVAQGIRLATEPTLKKIDHYVYGRMEGEADDVERFGVSMDNNLFRTQAIRELGGFPPGCPVCTDTILMKKMKAESPYRWVINPDAISEHVRTDIPSYTKHSYELEKMCARTPYCVNGSQQPKLLMARLFLTSPLRGAMIAWKERCPRAIYVYPMMRWQRLRASFPWQGFGIVVYAFCVVCMAILLWVITSA